MRMNLFKPLSIAIIFTTLAVNANAVYHEENGTATCYILKNNKLITKDECTYEGGLYVSVHEMRDEKYYSIKGHEEIYVKDLAHAIEGTRNNNIDFNPSNIEINGRPAREVFRYKKTLKQASSSDEYRKDILRCIQARSEILEVCVD